MKIIRFARFILAVGLLFAFGCRQAEESIPDYKVVEPKSEKITHNNITVEMSASPGQVEFDKDVILTVKILSTMAVPVEFQLNDDRLEGFEISGEIPGVPTETDGWVEKVNQYSLTPKADADRYRIAPVAVKYRDTAVSPVKTGWFPTKPMVFEPVVRLDVSDDENISVDISPFYVRPSFGAIIIYVLIALSAIALLALVFWLIRQAHEQIKIRKMSPKERAMRELEKLLAKHLVEHRKVKEFYLELTMIVRRYIERAYGIRAPEQTTQEFLEAVAENPVFAIDTVKKLKEFLESADLVKFAGYQPDNDAINVSVTTAREYIKTDSSHKEKEGE